MRVLQRAEIWAEGATVLGSGVGEHVLDLSLREQTIDVGLCEELPFSGESSDDIRSTLKRSEPCEWTSDDLAGTVGLSHERLREHDRVSWIRKVRVHHRVPVGHRDARIDHSNSDLQSLHVLAMPWQEART